MPTDEALETPRSLDADLFRHILRGLSCLRDLVEHGFAVDTNLLVVLDGAKGLRSAVREVFGERAQVQRRQWRKRENVVRYLPKSEQHGW